MTSGGLASCPQGTAIESVEECAEALQQLGVAKPDKYWTGNRADIPAGCSWEGKALHFNTGDVGGVNRSFRSICRAHVQVNGNGDIVQLDGTNPFPVHWSSGSPDAGVYIVDVKTESVFFDQLPTKDEVQERLKIGAVHPAQKCSQCDGDVKSYHPDGLAIDAHTIFEIDGKFYKNSETVVHLADSGKVFRDPPVFIGTRLIQRFGFSTPSRQYVRAVGAAFSEGSY